MKYRGYFEVMECLALLYQSAGGVSLGLPGHDCAGILSREDKLQHLPKFTQKNTQNIPSPPYFNKADKCGIPQANLPNQQEYSFNYSRTKVLGSYTCMYLHVHLGYRARAVPSQEPTSRREATCCTLKTVNSLLALYMQIGIVKWGEILSLNLFLKECSVREPECYCRSEVQMYLSLFCLSQVKSMLDLRALRYPFWELTDPFLCN